MSRTTTIAKFTLAFVIIAGGFSLIIGTLMGGGISRSYDAIKGVNKDPRSILVQAVLIEAGADSAALPAPGSALSDEAFGELASRAGGLGAEPGVRVRTPAMLVQHGESGSLSVSLGGRAFAFAVSPSVIDTKKGPVLRVALQIQCDEAAASDTTKELGFTTAYTSAPGGAVVLDLAGLGEAGARAVLALRTTLIDPTPAEAD